MIQDMSSTGRINLKWASASLTTTVPAAAWPRASLRSLRITNTVEGMSHVEANLPSSTRCAERAGLGRGAPSREAQQAAPRRYWCCAGLSGLRVIAMPQIVTVTGASMSTASIAANAAAMACNCALVGIFACAYAASSAAALCRCVCMLFPVALFSLEECTMRRGGTGCPRGN